MPDNVQDEGGKPKADDAGMMSTRGWIIVISVVVLEAVFFIVLIWFLSQRAPSDKDRDATVPLVAVDDIVRKDLVLEQLNYSKLSPGGAMQTLVMDIHIQMGSTERERVEGIRLPEEDWTRIGEVVKKLQPEILAELVSYIDKQPVSTLASPRGKEQIQNHVQEFINTRLRGLDLGLKTDKADNERVTRVLITRFFIQ